MVQIRDSDPPAVREGFPTGLRNRTSGWKTFLAVIGPGLVVMLADTDVGSIITAAQSGVQPPSAPY